MGDSILPVIMTSKERVLISFDFIEPDRVPRWCGTSPEFWEAGKKQLGLDDEGFRQRLGDDFRWIKAPFIDHIGTATFGDSSVSPFGILRAGVGVGMALNHPLSEAGLDGITAYPWPDPAKVDVSNLRKGITPYANEYAILGGDWSPFWHDAIDLAGMENLLTRMYTDPKWVHTLMDKVFDFYFAANERIFAEAGDLIDILFFGNDLGSNQGALIGEDLFREYLFPKFKKLACLAHSYESKIMLHCCGGFAELIPALIECGIDGLHAIQPSCRGMDLATLKKKYGKEIVFNGCIDSQKVLIEGTPEQVRQKTIETIRIMKPGGGFIAGASHDYILPETPLENVLVMMDIIGELGNRD